MSCARPSPRCRPMPSSSSVGDPSTPTTCRGSSRASGWRPPAWTAWSTTSSPWPASTRACPWRWRRWSWWRWSSDAVRTATAVGPEWPVRFSAARPVEVSGDKDRLRQVLDNLLANVRAHTPPGRRPRCMSTSDRRPGPDRGPRHRARHARRGGAAGLRALLPRRPCPCPHRRGQWPGALHRGRHRGRPRRDGHRRLVARARGWSSPS